MLGCLYAVLITPKGAVMPKRILLAGVAAIVLSVAQPAIAQNVNASYSCKVTADGKVIVAVNNPNAFQILCSVNCQFKIPGGSTGMSCSKSYR